MFRVASSDGVSVAVHHLAGDGDRPPLLISHATGFHAHCYVPLARALADRFDCFGADARGHGDTAAPEDWEVDWSAFGDDAAAAATSLAPDGGLVGVGHSMGGAALLMAAHRHPGLFDRLVLFEPVAHGASDGADIHRADMESLPIVRGARRRRRRFGSRDEAYGNYEDKPPLSVMTPEVLRLYVDHGLREVDGGLELCCDPQLEADIFVRGRENGAWDLLPEIDVPTLVVAGVVEEMQPARWAAGIAERLPAGRYLELPHLTHLGPFSHPDEVAALV